MSSVAPTRARLLAFGALAVIVPLGFSLKLFGTRWLANSVAGALYEVFWCLMAFLIFPSRRACLPIAASVFGATCAIEFAQLLHHPALETIRANFIGRTILGNSFTWTDFPYYALGSVAGYALLRALSPRDVYSGESMGS